MQKQKTNYKPLLFTLLLALVAAVTVMNFSGGSVQTTTPKIQVSYFKDNNEFVAAIESNLQKEMDQRKYYWIGFEPGKNEQFELLNLLKQNIEKKNGPFDVVIIDKELNLEEDQKKTLAPTHELFVKEETDQIAELVKANKDKKVLVITAAIYSSNLVVGNPLLKVKELTQIKPIAFSLGYFAVLPEDEKNILFKCDTEDKTGTSPWACGVLNKARAIRRRIDLQKLQEAPVPRIGLMDLTGENDYMVLVGK